MAKSKTNPFDRVVDVDTASMFQELAEDSATKPGEQGDRSLMPLDDIKDRDRDTRDLNTKHVITLANSIEALGLIEPLAVDKDGVLLAGGHRRAAIALLREQKPEAYDEHFPGGAVPVRIMEFSSTKEPDRAMQVEIAENEQRRDYTSKEIQAIAERLKQAGFEELKGRPGKGQKPLMPALSAVVGKSIRRIQQILDQESKQESPKSFGLSESDKHLKRAIASLEKWTKTRGRKRRELKLSEEIENVLSLLREGLGDD